MSSLKNTSKIQIIDPGPFLNKHTTENKPSPIESTQVSYLKTTQNINFDNLPENIVTEVANSSYKSKEPKRFSFPNLSSHKKYLIDKYSTLSAHKKLRLLIALGVLCAILLVLLVLLILFATGNLKKIYHSHFFVNYLNKIVPCSLTICHSRAHKCVNYFFRAHCLCDYGFNGDGKKFCDGKWK